MWNIKNMKLDLNSKSFEDIVRLYHKACQDNLTNKNKNFRTLVNAINSMAKSERVAEANLRMGERLRP